MSAVSRASGKPRRARKPPVYTRAHMVKHPATGNTELALFAASPTDAQQPAWDRLYAGERVRIEVTRPRNPGFFRMLHAIGKLASHNIDELSHLDAHETIKRLQAEAGVECDVVMLDAASMWDQITVEVQALLPDPATAAALEMIGYLLDGKQLAVRWPRSIAYDAMDEDAFRTLAQSICRHITRRYWPECPPEQVAEMAKMHMESA